MPHLNPLDEARDLTACLQHLMASHALLLKCSGADQRVLDAIQYHATDLEDVLGKIEGERIRELDERGLMYFPTDEMAAMKEVLTQAWLVPEPKVATSGYLNLPVRSLEEAR